MNIKKLITATLIVSVIVFVFPIIVYEFFMRFFGLVPPANFGWTDLFFMIPTTILGAFVFVIIFFLAKGSVIGQNGVLYGFLCWLGFSIVGEVGFWLVFKFSPIIMLAGITSGLCYLINGFIVEKFSK